MQGFTRKWIVLPVWMLLPVLLTAQVFERVTEIDVFYDGRQLHSPWTGGLNAPQIGEADFNEDGRNDLLFYDEDGEWMYVFIHITGDTYVYKPLYAEGLPDIQDWMILRDYNCDGISDLIMHGNMGSARTYRGYYEDGRLKFAPDKSIIYYRTSSGFDVNLYTIGTHRPVFHDVNGDGDLDFLAYDVSLLRISYYESLQVEDNLPCDSLFYYRADRCWGVIRETGISLEQTLLDTCDFRFFRTARQSDEQRRHPGGTALALYDEDNNGVYDLLLSDFTFSQMNYLRNNGTPEISNLYTQDASFPSYDQSVEIDIFPAPVLLDVDKDNDLDLLAAPFNAGAVDNYRNVAYYKNNGSDSNPFQFESNTFLVGDMIDVGETAAPAFFDYNGDGLRDIVVGNGGYYENGGTYFYSLTLFENTGTASIPEYTFADRNFLDIGALDVRDIAPFFGDIDSDGDKDLFAGGLSGKILFMTNANGNFVNPTFQKDHTGTDIDIGQSAKPVLFDLDDNGTLDLIIGTRDGNLVYYENTGSPNSPEFTFRTDTLGGAVSHPSNSLVRYSSPAFGDFDNDGRTDLLLGGADSRVKLYSDIGTDYDVLYQITADNFFNSSHFDFEPGDIYPRLSPAVADISADGTDEVLLGTNTGGLMLFSRDLSDTTNLAVHDLFVNDRLNAYPNPASDRLTMTWQDAFGRNGTILITVTDIIGRQIVRTEVADRGQVEIDLYGLQPGLYQVTLRGGGKMGTVSIVKQ
jgi:hypothetical protein